MSWWLAAEAGAQLYNQWVGDQAAEKAAAQQQAYTRSNMDYAAQLQRKQDLWKRDSLLRGKLTPWELAGTPPASAGSPLPAPIVTGKHSPY